ncbi:hypothetical protein D3C80_1085240 [compost metagenome]
MLRNLEFPLAPLIASGRGEIARVAGLRPLHTQLFIRIDHSFSRHLNQQRQAQVIECKAQLPSRTRRLGDARPRKGSRSSRYRQLQGLGKRTEVTCSILDRIVQVANAITALNNQFSCKIDVKRATNVFESNFVFTRPRLGKRLGIPVEDDRVTGHGRCIAGYLGAQALAMVSQVALREAVALDFLRVFQHRQHALSPTQCRRGKVDQQAQGCRGAHIAIGAGHFIAQLMGPSCEVCDWNAQQQILRKHWGFPLLVFYYRELIPEQREAFRFTGPRIGKSPHGYPHNTTTATAGAAATARTCT